MDIEETKNKIRQFNEEVWNKGNIAIIDEILAPNYICHDLATGNEWGRDSMKQLVTQVRADYDNLHVEVEEILVEGNRAALRYTTSGTDKQGQSGKIFGISIYHFEDGLLIKDYTIDNF